MDRYGVPEWARPYVYKYVSRNKADLIRTAISLIGFGRKKGQITRRLRDPAQRHEVQAGLDSKADRHLLPRRAEAGRPRGLLGREATVGNPEYERGTSALADIDYKGARAMKNLVEGLKTRCRRTTAPWTSSSAG
jgi:hypothetical protein